jgi:oxygen-independent coproporphyrinogen-3 oxidase
MRDDSRRGAVLTQATDGSTAGGSYFVSNYPPFHAWTAEAVREVEAALDQPPVPGTPLGVYVHIPFCRKRCHFCYFKVYTDRNAGAIREYLDAVLDETRHVADRPLIAGRRPAFVYFGGGTPSYLSVEQLQHLFDGLRAALPWDDVEEVAFECEPGTLNDKKLAALRAMGVTRLSLGVENFDDRLLEVNNRAHNAEAIDRAYATAREVGFPQINIDLIAGMMDETQANWDRCIERTLALEPDSVTIYQMEIPFNTTIFKQMKEGGHFTAPVADWPTKRRWVAEAFERLEQAGYTVTSAYTAVRDPRKAKFIYRDALWRGADMLGLGVSSFGHLRGVHYQNEKDIGPYIERVNEGELPLRRAMTLSDHQRLVRELVLQMKLGVVSLAYFREKFGVAVDQQFAQAFGALEAAGDLTVAEGELRLTRSALLRVDTLLTAFFEPHYQPAAA